jgi:translation initiation factor 2 subunit 2
MEYEKMLDRIYAGLPKRTLSKERFEMPRAESLVQGKKTIIKNFSAIAKTIKRDEKHMFKFITKESASAGATEEGRLILNGKFSETQINELIKNYITQFVLCPECKKPDTQIKVMRGVKVLKCEACGAISSVKGL